MSPKTHSHPEKSTKFWPLAVMGYAVKSPATPEPRQVIRQPETANWWGETRNEQYYNTSSWGTQETKTKTQRIRESVSAADPDSWALRNAWLILTGRKKPKLPPYAKPGGQRSGDHADASLLTVVSILISTKETSEDHMGLSVGQFKYWPYKILSKYLNIHSLIRLLKG